MDKSYLALDETANENFLGIRHRLKDCEDLMTFRVSPPTSLDGLAGNHLG
jgi:hypothetical protein